MVLPTRAEGVRPCGPLGPSAHALEDGVRQCGVPSLFVSARGAGVRQCGVPASSSVYAGGWGPPVWCPIAVPACAGRRGPPVWCPWPIKPAGRQARRCRALVGLPSLQGVRQCGVPAQPAARRRWVGCCWPGVGLGRFWVAEESANVVFLAPSCRWAGADSDPGMLGSTFVASHAHTFPAGYYGRNSTMPPLRNQHNNTKEDETNQYKGKY